MGGFNSVLPSSGNGSTASGVPLGNTAGDSGPSFSFASAPTPTASSTSFAMPDTGGSGNWASQAWQPSAAMTQPMPSSSDVQVSVADPVKTGWTPKPVQEQATQNLLDGIDAPKPATQNASLMGNSLLGSNNLLESTTREKVNPIVSKLARENSSNAPLLSKSLIGAPEVPKPQITPNPYAKDDLPKLPRIDWGAYDAHRIGGDKRVMHDDWARIINSTKDFGGIIPTFVRHIDTNGDVGRGDAADMMWRVAETNPQQAQSFQRQLTDALGGEVVPIRRALMQGENPPADTGDGPGLLVPQKQMAPELAKTMDAIQNYPQWREANLPYFQKRYQDILNGAEANKANLPDYAIMNLSQTSEGSGQGAQNQDGSSAASSNPYSIEAMAKDSSVMDRIQQEQTDQRRMLDEYAKDSRAQYGNRIEGAQADSSQTQNNVPKQAPETQPQQAAPIKPKAAFDSVVGDKTTPPAYKKGYLSKQPGVWEGFNKAADKLPGAGENQKFALAQTFAAEGGTAKDPNSSASSGIMQKTLDDARKRVPGLENAKTPSDLSLDQRAAVMKDYFDQNLRTVGGAKALDNLPSPEAAAAFGDTIYRHGTSGGAKLIQKAIDDVSSNKVPYTGVMDQSTYNAFSDLASNSETHGQLLDALAKRRDAATNWEESTRMNYFRFTSTR